jgi:U3 small nucleolar RNA-associated protein 5
MLDWIREVVVIHAGYLVSQGDEIKQVLEQLKGTLQRRGQTWERLVRLKGRLELLRAVKGPEGSNVGKEPEVRWVAEGDEEFEEEFEDVRYLTGGDEVESVVDGDADEIDGMEKVLSSDEEEKEEDDDDDDDETDDDDESSDESVRPTKKANGIPHFSDGEDSAVDLEDLLDDQASEASDDESEDDDDEDEEEEEEEEEEILRPKKKSKSKR